MVMASGGTLRAGWYTEEGEERDGTRRIKKVRSPKRRQSWVVVVVDIVVVAAWDWRL